MECLDADAVQRWFDAVPAAGRDLPTYLAGPLSAEEREVLDTGRGAVLAALGADEPDLRPDARPLATEDAAAWLADYLAAFAAGLADARRAEQASPGQASPLHVVAGLITGAAAVAGRPGARATGRLTEPAEWGTHASFPSAAEAAHRLGAAAADEAVSGAPLDRVTRAAHDAGPRSSELSAPTDSAAALDLQRRRLLVRLISALADATCPAAPAVALPQDAPGWRPGCVQSPDRHAGEPLVAEITFLTADESAAADLADVLRAAGVSYGTYSDGRSLGFHIHARDPGAVVSEIFSLVLPFDLRISWLAGA